MSKVTDLLFYLLKIGGYEVAEIDLVTRGIEGRVVQLNWVSLKVFDHLFNAPKTKVLDLASRFRHFHSQML